jgi:predicted CXXCH cytochrome family protein
LGKNKIILKIKQNVSVILSFMLIFSIISVSAFSIYAGSAEVKKPPKERCIECHGDSIQYKEWQNSDHAKAIETIQKEPKADYRCVRCHSSDYKPQTNPWATTSSVPLGPKDVTNAVSCSSCHRHGTGFKHNLIMPVDKLCISCHKFDCG